MWKEFKEFAVKGNAFDLAVGVIIGAAFGGIVNSLVKDIIMPPVGLITGGLDFSNKFLILKHPPGGGFFDFTFFNLAILARDFLHRLESILVWNDQHGADEALFPAPRRSDVRHRLIAPAQSIRQNSRDHPERDQKQENQNTDTDQFDDRSIAFPE